LLCLPQHAVRILSTAGWMATEKGNCPLIILARLLMRMIPANLDLDCPVATVSGVRAHLSVAMLLTLGVLMAGCDRDGQLRSYGAPKETPRDATAMTTPNPAAAPVGATWSAPVDWEKEPDQPMRIASWHAGKTEIIVARLAQNNIGDLLSNVNRWRKMA